MQPRTQAAPVAPARAASGRATPRIAGLEVAAHPDDHWALATYFAAQHPLLSFQLYEPDGTEPCPLPCTVGMSLMDPPVSNKHSEHLMSQVDELLRRIVRNIVKH